MRLTRLLLCCLAVAALPQRALAQGNPSAAIVNGFNAPANRYPYAAPLYINEGSGTSYFCMSTLIHPRLVLTAAHCVKNDNTGVSERDAIYRPQVRVGAHQRTSGAGYDLRTVITTVPHPGFVYKQRDPNSMFFFDAALMLLDKPSSKDKAPLPPFTQKPSLPKPVNTQLAVLGFGDTRPGTRSPAAMLQQANLGLRDLDTCDSEYDKIPGFTAPANPLICAGNPSAYHSNTCVGDSGGPLIFAPAGGKASGDMLVGITSFAAIASVCTGEPSGYTNVAQIRPWIDDTIAQLTSGDWTAWVRSPASNGVNIQAFDGRQYRALGGAGSNVNIYSGSGVWSLQGTLAKQDSGRFGQGVVQFKRGASAVAVTALANGLAVQVGGQAMAQGSAPQDITSGGVSFPQAPAGRAAQVVITQPYLTITISKDPAQGWLEVTVRAQRMPDVPVTGVLGANMAWQRKKSG